MIHIFCFIISAFHIPSFKSASRLEYQGGRKNRKGDLLHHCTKGVSKPIQTDCQNHVEDCAMNRH